MMTADMPPIEVTLKEFADELGLPIWTVRGWSKTKPDFPTGRWVGSAKVYRLTELREWKRKNPKLGLGRGGNQRKPD